MLKFCDQKEMVKKWDTLAPETKEKIIALLKDYDENGKSVHDTSVRMRVSPKRVNNWVDGYWPEYLRHIEETTISQIQKEANLYEKSLVKRIEKITTENEKLDKISSVFDKVINRIHDIVNDPDLVENLKPAELINIANILLPYVAEKKASTTEKPQKQYNQFVTNILAQLRNEDKAITDQGH